MRLIALGALLVACAAAMGRAAVVFDAHGFEPPRYEEGKLVGQNGWVQKNNTSSTAEVQKDFVRSGSQALRLKSAIGQNHFFPPVNFVPAMGDLIVVECDIARTASSTPSFGYFIDVIGTDGQRVARAGLGRDGTNIRAIRTLPTGNSPANGIVYAPMQWVHFEIIFRICRVCKSNPSPKSSTPALFETHVSPVTPLSRSATIRCSGIPHSPNPPTITVIPSRNTPLLFRSASAAAAVSNRFWFIAAQCSVETCISPHSVNAGQMGGTGGSPASGALLACHN